VSTGSLGKVVLATALVIIVIFAVIYLNQYRSYSSSVTTGDFQGSLEYGGLQRTYLIHIPSSYNGTKAVPLVLVFHGGGGTGAGMATISGMSNTSDVYGFIVIYPDGYMKGWNDGRGITAASLANVDDVGFISQLIDTISSQYKIDPSRIYATGLSNGGFFTGRLACQLANKIAAFAIVAATMAPNMSATCNPGRPISVLMIQGDADPLVPINGGLVRGPFGGPRGYVLSLNDTVKRWLQIDGCTSQPTVFNIPDTAGDGTSITQSTYTSCQNDVSVVVYVVHGGGHAWPGGQQYLPQSVIGQTSRNMNASQVIWMFFDANPMP